MLSAVTDHLLFDELEAFGAWDTIKAATDVVFEVWNYLTLGIPDEALCQPVCAWRVTEAEFKAAFSWGAAENEVTRRRALAGYARAVGT